MEQTIIERIKRELEGFQPKIEQARVGRVISSGDGVAEIEGLSDAAMSEMVVFDDDEGKPLEEVLKNPRAIYGFLLNLEETSSRAVILGDAHRVREGMLVRGLGRVLSINISESMVGRVVSPLGEPLDGKGPIAKETDMPIEREAYGVIDRAPVDTPVHTGVMAIDAMVPIGRGQRELIIGDRFSGKTTLAIDTVINQKNEPESSRPVCIYVAIGQKSAKTARLVAELSERGAMEYSIVVSASAADTASLQFLAPYAGAAIGEYFMDKGRDAIVIYDDLSKHAVAYRQISLLLRRPPGREAYPGDIFYLHSRLLERSAKLSEARGGGSLTALPIIETQEGDVSAYIPTNVISITDGQIYLNIDLFNKGMRPAIDVGLSVSRVGSNAQTKAMKKVAGKIRLELAQFRELEAFMQFSQDLDEATKKRIERGKLLTEALKQDKHNPLPFERQVPILYAVFSEQFSNMKVEETRYAKEKFLSFLDVHYPHIFNQLREEKVLSERVENELQAAAASFKQAHPEFFG